ncbi:MAG: hypothetical protein KJZ78_02225 [Bryobacteraceae bacterium]|nr:hypothetical protein [Bryobacteraceae bacterium]
MAVPETQRASGVGRAWLALCFALSLHVLDEASTGFPAVYNPTVMAMREKLPWLPLPVFDFKLWIAGLIAAILLLFSLSPFVFRGARWTRPASYAFAVFMTVNALGHIAGTLLGRTVETVRFSGPMPGFYSSPFLLAASIYILFQLRASRPRLPLTAE